MVTGAGSDAQARPPSSLPLPVGQRLVVTALSNLLPAGFRARQRAEWAGDLLALEDGPSGVRWRYLLGAARTLPALRAAAGRNRCADPPLLPRQILSPLRRTPVRQLHAMRSCRPPAARPGCRRGPWLDAR